MVFEGLTLCYQPHRHIVFQKDIFDSNIVYIANVRKLAFLYMTLFYTAYPMYLCGLKLFPL